MRRFLHLVNPVNPVYYFFMRPTFLLLIVASLMLGGCAELAYYGHAAAGQLEVISNRRPIPEVIVDPETPEAVRDRLQYIERAHDFAISELHLPDSESYRSYSDVGRRYVLWNVFATPELSLQQKQWCYPFFGCQGYRAFFDEEYAHDVAEELQAEGWDVYVASSPAYSTRGWFADPIYNSVLNYAAIDSAAILFHELAHEKIYLKNDSQANESFAMTVQLEGVRRWLIQQGDKDSYADYKILNQRDRQFVALLIKHRKQLEKLYFSNKTDNEKQAGKIRTLNLLRRGYRTLKKSWGGYRGYDHWFDKSLNNAVLAPVGTYHGYVAEFKKILLEHGNDLKSFYRVVEMLADLEYSERRIILQGKE